MRSDDLRVRVLILATVVVFAATPALPCRRISQTLSLLEVPAEVVPPNVTWLAPRTTPYVTDVWWIRVAGNEANEFQRMTIAFDDDATRVTPPEPLVPNTSYELLLTRHRFVPTPRQPFDNPDDLEVVAGYTVTASASDDDDPPPAPEIVDVRTESHWGDDTSCGITPAGTFVIMTIAPEENTYALRRERVDEDGSAVRVFIHPHDGAPAHANGAPVTDYADDESGVHEYRIIAIDQAGNESAPATVNVDLGLPGACATTGATPFTITALLLMIIRRRRAR